MAKGAKTRAAMAGRPAPTLEDVRAAYEQLPRDAMGTSAVRMEALGDWSALAVEALTRDELSLLELRCRRREALAQRRVGGVGAPRNVGVRALFLGPSGTGKTLAARVLASVLGRELYRVNLASVVSKYIGETEKSLERVFSRAEEMDVVLLRDEGDALMGRRTSVQSANDRYANLETNYLLQLSALTRVDPPVLAKMDPAPETQRALLDRSWPGAPMDRYRPSEPLHGLASP